LISYVAHPSSFLPLNFTTASCASSPARGKGGPAEGIQGTDAVQRILLQTLPVQSARNAQRKRSVKMRSAECQRGRAPQGKPSATPRGIACFPDGSNEPERTEGNRETPCSPRKVMEPNKIPEEGTVQRIKPRKFTRRTGGLGQHHKREPQLKYAGRLWGDQTQSKNQALAHRVCRGREKPAKKGVRRDFSDVTGRGLRREGSHHEGPDQMKSTVNVLEVV